MFRWWFTIFLALVLLSSALPWLERLGIGKLPGDVRFRIFGLNIFLPFASTVVLSVLVFGIGKLL